MHPLSLALLLKEYLPLGLTEPFQRRFQTRQLSWYNLPPHLRCAFKSSKMCNFLFSHLNPRILPFPQVFHLTPGPLPRLDFCTGVLNSTFFRFAHYLWLGQSPQIGFSKIQKIFFLSSYLLFYLHSYIPELLKHANLSARSRWLYQVLSQSFLIFLLLISLNFELTLRQW